MFRTPNVTWIAVCSAVAMGCSSDPKPPPDTGNQGNVAPSPPPANTQAQGDDDDDDSSNVSIDDRVARMCNLPETRFGFDSAAMTPEAKSTLDKLATCFISGPGKGKGLRIVGHADPRGETEYNFALGQRRAGSVASYITKAGVEETRVEASSRGELEATGTDETGWARDRRVEILLAE